MLSIYELRTYDITTEDVKLITIYPTMSGAYLMVESGCSVHGDDELYHSVQLFDKLKDAVEYAQDITEQDKVDSETIDNEYKDKIKKIGD